MQTQEIHHTWEAKGAPWKMVKEFTRMSTVHHKKRDTSSDRSRLTNSGDTLMAVVTKPLMCARVPSLEPQVRMSGWACSNSYLYLCCLVVQWGYCSPLHAPLPAQGTFHFELLLREGMGVSSEAESTEQPLPWPYSILTSKLGLVLQPLLLWALCFPDSLMTIHCHSQKSFLSTLGKPKPHQDPEALFSISSPGSLHLAEGCPFLSVRIVLASQHGLGIYIFVAKP